MSLLFVYYTTIYKNLSFLVYLNENELNRIGEYIMKNPEMWMRDRNNGDLWL